MMMLLSLLLAVQTAPAPSETPTFRDWTVACDNGRSCRAVGLLPEESGDWESHFTLIVDRGPEPGAPLRFRLAGPEQAPVRMRVDGTLLPARIIVDDPDYTIEPHDPAAFTQALLAGSQLQLDGATGGTVGTASLAGLTAALLYMDEKQGRIGTRTAVVRPGPGAPSAVPPAPRLPQVRLAPRTSEQPLTVPAARIAELRRQVNCTIDEVGGPDEADSAALGEGRTLILLACGSGAYNITHIPFIARRQGLRIAIDPAPFDEPLADYEREAGRRMLVNAGWNAETRTLDDFPKARGIGDCGTRSSYGWDGTRFRLVHREEMPECRGSITFLTTWRAEVIR